MNDEEQAIAESFASAVQDASHGSERSIQSAEFRLGPSDIGFCSERTRRMLAGIPEPRVNVYKAFVGTALGDHVEQAILKYAWPLAIIQSEVTITLPGSGGRTYTIGGHPDVIEGNKVLDIKTVNGVEKVAKDGPSLAQQFQRHCYAKGAFEAGMLQAESLDDVMVGNVWFDRSGEVAVPHVQMEPYSEQYVIDAGAWIDDVVYAYVNGEEARKEPPVQMCWVACGHAPDCRGGESDVEGLIEDPSYVNAVDLLLEAREMEKRAKRMKNEAQLALRNVEGSTGQFTVKWVHVNGGSVSFNREPYLRLDIRKVR